tara:strand:+ start:1776 stop:2522 length:747 start_codon:yes stop_codon:yes gene_type:complete
MNPIQIYNDYLIKIDKDHQKKRAVDNPNNNFEASSGGLCMKRHYYKSIGAEKSPTDVDALRTMRLGTVMHNEFEKAIDDAAFQHPNLKIMQEILVESEYLGVTGHLDLLIVDEEGKGSIYDWKTAKSFKFKQVFGGKNASSNYEIQLGTYASLSLEMGLCKEIKHMGLLYYSKDTSEMAELGVNLSFIKRAEEYWLSVKNLVKTAIQVNIEPQPENNRVPVYKWECNYCNYSPICNSPLNKNFKGGKL